MKKNSPLYEHDDNIDLVALFKIILDGKVKILLITIISFLVGFGYNSQIPKNYLNSLTISVKDNFEFIKLANFQKLLQFNKSNKSNKSDEFNLLNKLNKSNELYRVKLINELKDYDEYLSIIKNTKKVQEYFSKQNIENKEIELIKYVKLLSFVKPGKNEENFIINFEWDDPDEAKKIFQDTLNLASENLKKKIELELSLILELEKKLILNTDRERLNYLQEQSAIAKELNIIDNQIDNVNLTQSNVSLNINTADIAYYLRGYKAIDKEIDLIKNRNYITIKLIEQEIDSFKKDNIEWIDYNIYLMEVKSLKNTKLIFLVSILLGLIVGTFYVLISYALQFKTASKKTN